MTASYNSVSVGGSEYDVYAAVADADHYLEAEFSDAATRWRDATKTTDDDKARATVSGTRVIDRQTWPGSKTGGEYQTLQWPRTGTGIDGVDDDVIPQAIVDASILLAAEINSGTNVAGSTSTDDRIKRQQAGSVSLEYFRDLSDGQRFPTAIQELLAPYLAGATSTLAGALSYGTSECSDFGTGYAPVGSL